MRQLVASLCLWSSCSAQNPVFSDGGSQGDGSLPGDAGIFTTADPSKLPLASRQPPNITAWTQLGVTQMAGGNFYKDPVTGVTVWKVTSASVPVANPGGKHDYSEGGWEVSLPHGTNGKTYTILIGFTDNSEYYLVDFERGVGFSNWRRMVTIRPRGDLYFSFSARPETAHIAFVHDGNAIHRYNVETNGLEDSGNFPYTNPPSGPWFHQDENDTWFVMLDGKDKVAIWNSTTNLKRSRTFTNLDEPHLERHGRFVAVKVNTSAIVWDIQSDTVQPLFSDTGNFPEHALFTHPAAARGYFVSENANEAAPFYMYRLEPGPPRVAVKATTPGIAGDIHLSGNWLQNESMQWILGTSNDDGRFAGTSILSGVGFFLGNGGSETRLLCHHYAKHDDSDYWELARAKINGDGSLVLFDSDMQNSGRSDLFLVEVP